MFLAHDVSYFVHLNALKPGDVITYSTACNTWKYQVSDQQVVTAGSPSRTRPTPRWCSTRAGPQRALLHLAAPARARHRGGHGGEERSLDPGKEFIDTIQSTNYSTSAPPQLQAQGLSLDQNYAPMGTMSLVNASVSFAQSPGPLSLEAAALETYFGGLHAADQQNPGFWGALAPGVAMPPSSAGPRSATTCRPSTSRSTRPTEPQIRWCYARRSPSRAARIPATTRRRSFSLFTRVW